MKKAFQLNLLFIVICFTASAQHYNFLQPQEHDFTFRYIEYNDSFDAYYLDRTYIFENDSPYVIRSITLNPENKSALVSLLNREIVLSYELTNLSENVQHLMLIDPNSISPISIRLTKITDNRIQYTYELISGKGWMPLIEDVNMLTEDDRAYIYSYLHQNNLLRHFSLSSIVCVIRVYGFVSMQND